MPYSLIDKSKTYHRYYTIVIISLCYYGPQGYPMIAFHTTVKQVLHRVR